MKGPIAIKEFSAPRLEYVFDLTAYIGPATSEEVTPHEIRRVIPILGGVFEGAAIRGTVLRGGADSQRIFNDGLTIIDAEYLIETEDDVRISVRNRGVRHGPKLVMAKLRAGNSVDPSEYYFRTTPCFEPHTASYEWLRRSVFVGDAARHPDRVVVRIWRVL
jgi:hypothetical protein